MIVFMLLIVFLFLNLKKKPFASVALNDLETTSLITSMITIYCGIFYISDMSGFDFKANIAFAELDNGCKILC